MVVLCLVVREKALDSTVLGMGNNLATFGTSATTEDQIEALAAPITLPNAMLLPLYQQRSGEGKHNTIWRYATICSASRITAKLLLFSSL
jgi:hypothetical protein